MEYQTYQQDYEYYSGKINLCLNIGANFARDLLISEAALWSQGLSPNLEFIVYAEGSTVWQ